MSEQDSINAFGPLPGAGAQAQAPAPAAPPQDDVWSRHFQMLSPEQAQSVKQLAAQGSGGSLMSDPELQGLQGEDFMTALRKKNPQFADRLQRVGEGRESYPTGNAVRAPINTMLIQAIGQAYPGWSQQDFKTRADTLAAFTPRGKEGQRLAAANQAILHANSALDASHELGGSDILPGIVNPVRNLIEGQISPDFQRAKARYEQFITATGEELTNAFRGRGGGTQEEINNWRKNALSANSPTSREAAIQAGMELLHGSLSTMANEYDQGMRSASQSKDPRDFIYGPNRPIFEKLLGKKVTDTTSQGFYGDGGRPAPGTPQTTDQAPAAAAPPKPGNYIYIPGKGLVPR